MIDWFTVGAQIVNFLILLALLKYLLFDRIVRAMDEREQKIADRLEEAAAKEDEATRRSEGLAEERRQLEAQREEKLQQAKAEADRRRRELVGEAREEIDQLRGQWRSELDEQKERFVDELNAQAADALSRAVRRALSDLADADLQAATVRRFVALLEGLDEESRQPLREAIDGSNGKVVIASADPLSDALRRQLDDALRRQFELDGQPTYETARELIAGVELRSHSQALGWNLRRYVEEFDEAMKQAIEEQAEAARGGEQPENEAAGQAAEREAAAEKVRSDEGKPDEGKPQQSSTKTSQE
jgi:F-type H+-transporting ATPase subunit b